MQVSVCVREFVSMSWWSWQWQRWEKDFKQNCIQCSCISHQYRGAHNGYISRNTKIWLKIQVTSRRNGKRSRGFIKITNRKRQEFRLTFKSAVILSFPASPQKIKCFFSYFLQNSNLLFVSPPRQKNNLKDGTFKIISKAIYRLEQKTLSIL